jgi:tRNA A-37 threonylcarbamoyl transferase component Bud32
VLSFLAHHPHLEQERARMFQLFQRVGQGVKTPPPAVWSAVEAALARDAADQAARVPTPVRTPSWRRPRERAGAMDDAGSDRDALLFGKVALNWRLVSRDLLNRALHFQRTQAPHLQLGELLLEKGILTRAQVDEILVYQDRIRTIRASAMPASEVATASMPMGGVAGGATPGLVDRTPSAAPPEGAPEGDFDPLIDTVIGGCRVSEKIGAGAMGAIYLANHEKLQKEVVVKLLAPEQASNPRTMERFFREARAAASLEHPNVVSVYDTGTTSTGLPYIVMQYVQGSNLDEVIEERGKLDLREALKIISGTAGGLAVAHAAGVIHRDVKASNIMLSTSGEAMLADFGLAKDLNSELKLTADGAMIGTPLYMAPEIGRARVIDGRVDLYSLGVTFYYLITGVQPFRGFSALDILSAKAHDKLKPPEVHLPEISDDVRNVLGKMLAKDRDDRYADMTVLIQDLQRLERGEVPEAAQGSGPWAPRELAGAGGRMAKRNRGQRKANPSGEVAIGMQRDLKIALLVGVVLVIVVLAIVLGKVAFG